MDMFIFLFVLFVVVAVPIAIWGRRERIQKNRRADREREEAYSEREEAYRNAKKAYKDSLWALSEDSANATLNYRTLELGRKLARMTRPNGVAMFDEIALQNDIKAVTAGKVEVQGTVETVPGQEPTKECQFCGGITLKRFIKCKHCGSDFE